jgi:hypothetical protein
VQNDVALCQSSASIHCWASRCQVVRCAPFAAFARPQVSHNPCSKTAVREQTRDGDELVAFVARVFRGEVEGVKLRDRLDADTWLADRSFGKPTEGVELAGKDGPFVTAVARKLLIAINAMMRDHRPWQPAIVAEPNSC